MHGAKWLWFFWVPMCTFNLNKLNLTGFCTWLTGDDGSSDEPQQGVLVKESESLYTLWCTGRAGCDGMLVEIKVRAVANILVLKLVSRYVYFFLGGGVGGQRHETLSWSVRIFLRGLRATWLQVWKKCNNLTLHELHAMNINLRIILSTHCSYVILGVQYLHKFEIKGLTIIM